MVRQTRRCYWILIQLSFGLSFNPDVSDDILLEVKAELYKEIDFLTIYANLSMVESYNMPTVRRKIFLANYSYYKTKEKEQNDKQLESRGKQNYSFNKINVR